MNFNEMKVKGKWNEFKGEVQKAWGRITGDELEQTKGDLKSIGGIIQQKYGEAQQNYSTKLNDIAQRFDYKKDDLIENVKSTLKASGD